MPSSQERNNFTIRIIPELAQIPAMVQEATAAGEDSVTLPEPPDGLEPAALTPLLQWMNDILWMEAAGNQEHPNHNERTITPSDSEQSDHDHDVEPISDSTTDASDLEAIENEFGRVQVYSACVWSKIILYLLVGHSSYLLWRECNNALTWINLTARFSSINVSKYYDALGTRIRAVATLPKDCTVPR
ncbi:hypothetical protein BDV97DRAFT_366679 [Delphinella strobiligena]|nr:hypothetical protein BDV97DRAFT_366679 [Delphinella strobiligena]